MENYKKFFLYYFPHYFHKSLAEIIKAKDLDILSIKKGISNRIFSYIKFSLRTSPYDILFCEGTFLIPALFKAFPIKRFRKFIVNISADPNLYYFKIGRMNILKRFLYKLSLPKVDVFLCIGEMEKDILKEILPQAKCIVIHPFIEEDRYNHLLSLPIKENFNHNILFIGNGPDYFCKGLDLLTETFRIVKKFLPDANLYILGDWDKGIQKKFSYDGIHFIGFSSTIHEYINLCSLYLHLGKGETFGISVLEALLGGLPSIVSEFTGTKEVIKELREDFVVPIDPVMAAQKVLEYFSLPDGEKKKLSQKSREIGKKFKKELTLNNFLNKWNSILICKEQERNIEKFKDD